jgi:Mn2+/Fe2+ NRAMP family transporter
MARKKQTGYSPSFKEYQIDFHIGYVGSAVLALFFLGLGALVMYGTGNHFSDNGVTFSEQLIALYSGSIGSWSTTIIAIVVLITMFSTALTVIDGYPRSLEGSLIQLFPSLEKMSRKIYIFWTIFLLIAALIIIGYFTKNMLALLRFATVLSFLTNPVFAIINYKIVTSKSFPEELKQNKWLIILSWAGIIFLIGFCIIFLFYVLF